MDSPITFPKFTMVQSPEPSQKQRISSIDILRGLVMLIMAIDHVRDFFHYGHPEPEQLDITTPILFFTRWITHFCAPIFVFLSGISAYLASTRRTPNQMSAFLIKRGLWLIAVELVFITFAITLNPDFHRLIFQVIWAIGGSMILLGLLVWVRASLSVIAIIGVIIFFGHNIFDVVKIHTIQDTFFGQLFFSAIRGHALWPLGNGYRLFISYALLPWTSLMLIGYVFGCLYAKSFDAAKRHKILLYSGLGLLVIFLVLRCFNIYGDPVPWSPQNTVSLSVISFFNVTKYPPSLLYLCMTIGPALIVLSMIENIQNKFTSILIIYGNVPFFYYVCHWYLIKLINIIVFYLSGHNSGQIINPHRRNWFQPDDFGYNLLGVYIVWLIVIMLLYLPCKWFSKYKKTHQQWWLSYL